MSQPPNHCDREGSQCRSRRLPYARAVQQWAPASKRIRRRGKFLAIAAAVAIFLAGAGRFVVSHFSELTSIATFFGISDPRPPTTADETPTPPLQREPHGEGKSGLAGARGPRLDENQPQETEPLDECRDVPQLPQAYWQILCSFCDNRFGSPRWQAFAEDQVTEIIEHARGLSEQALAKLYRLRAELYLRQERFEEARRDLDESKRLWPDDPETLRLRKQLESDAHQLGENRLPAAPFSETAEAISDSISFAGQIDPIADVDTFHFDGGPGSTIQLQITADDSTVDVIFYDPAASGQVSDVVCVYITDSVPSFGDTDVSFSSVFVNAADFGTGFCSITTTQSCTNDFGCLSGERCTGFDGLPNSPSRLAANAATWAGRDAQPAIACVEGDPLFFGSHVEDLLNSEGLSCSSVIAAADLDSADLSGFDVLYTGATRDNVPDLVAAATNVQNFVDAGGGLVVETNIVDAASWTWVPQASAIGHSGPANLGGMEVDIVDPDHPVMEGLEDGLSDWGISVHSTFVNAQAAGFQVLALGENPSSGNSEPYIIALDPDIEPLVFTITELPEFGTLVDSTGAPVVAGTPLPDAMVTYTNTAPTPSDSFTYQVAEGGVASTAVVTVYYPLDAGDTISIAVTANDHRADFTSQNVYKGLAGAFLLFDDSQTLELLTQLDKRRHEVGDNRPPVAILPDFDDIHAGTESVTLALTGSDAEGDLTFSVEWDVARLRYATDRPRPLVLRANLGDSIKITLYPSGDADQLVYPNDPTISANLSSTATPGTTFSFNLTDEEATVAGSAIVVGIDGYPSESGFDPLLYAANDARAVATELRRLGFSTTLLLNEAATREEILRSMARLPSAPGSLNLIHFATHAVADPSGEERLATYGSGKSSFLTADEISKALPKSLNLVVVDACSSVGGINRREVVGPTLTVAGDLLFPDGGLDARGLFRREDAQPKKTIVYLFASQPDERAFESHDYRAGVFTHSFVEYLKTLAPGRFFRLDTRELFRQTATATSELARRYGVEQVPRMRLHQPVSVADDRQCLLTWNFIGDTWHFAGLSGQCVNTSVARGERCVQKRVAGRAAYPGKP